MPRLFPDFDRFVTLASEYDIVPIYRQMLGDTLTPVSAFELLGKEDNAFLLESVVGGERVGRHSFIVTRPTVTYQARHGNTTLWTPLQTTRGQTADPLADLRLLLGRHRVAPDPQLPSFTGGLVGYAGYDLARYYEPDKLTAGPPDDRGLPEVHFGLYDDLVIFDHVDKTIRLVANTRIPRGIDLDRDALNALYEQARGRIDDLAWYLKQPGTLRLGDIDTASPLRGDFSANLSQQQYEDAVRSGLEYIRAGDIFQFVPSVRLRVESQADPFDVYRALRIVNPSPFMFYLKTPACTLIGSSPEILCRVRDRRVTTRPLAGTRPRGKTPEDDLRLERELLDDPKEQAEHIMLVDLHRNDVGRVSEPGSVTIDERMVVERYSHVMHISSSVSGTLAAEYDAMDALRVSLPVGTVSGAPKIRAMQIIDEAEPTRRGPYGGAVGYMDFAGNMDTCIALRTIVHRQGIFDVQAGAGVVADSVPASEYAEAINKAKAMLKGVELATRGFGSA